MEITVAISNYWNKVKWKKYYFKPSIFCKCLGVTFFIFCVILWHLLVQYYESFLRDLKAGNIKAWGTRLLFAVACVAFSKQQLSTNENRDKISFWEKISKIGKSESRKRRQIMRALRKGKEVISEENQTYFFTLAPLSKLFWVT